MSFNTVINVGKRTNVTLGYAAFKYDLFGQSNIRGVNDASNVDQKYKDPQQAKIFFNQSQGLGVGNPAEWQTLEYGVNDLSSDVSAIGTNIPFSNKLSSLIANKIYLSQRSPGGSDFELIAGNDWNDASTNEYRFEFLVRQIEQSMWRLVESEKIGIRRTLIAGIIQGIGEEASKKSNNTSYYQTQNQSLINDVIAKYQELGYDTTYFINVIQRTHNNLPSGTFPFVSDVRTQQAAIADNLQNTDDLPLESDNVHFSALGQITNGERTADTFINEFSNYPSAPTYGGSNDRVDDVFHLLDTQPNTTIKNALDTFITTCINDGNFDLMDQLLIPLDTENNSLIDLIGFYNRTDRKAQSINNPTFNSNQGWSLNGSTQYINSGARMGETSERINWNRSTQDDAGLMVHLITNSDPSLEFAHLLGGIDGTRVWLRQRPAANQIDYAVNSNSISSYVNAPGSFSNDTIYAIERVSSSGTNATNLRSNGNILHQDTTSSSSVNNLGDVLIGARNSVSPTQFFNGVVGMYCKYKAVGFDHSSFNTAYRQYLTDIAQ